MPQPKTPSAPSHQGRSASGKVPGAGLHSISTTGKRYGPTEATVALAVPSYAPHCASTTPTGYTCPAELGMLIRSKLHATACPGAGARGELAMIEWSDLQPDGSYEGYARLYVWDDSTQAAEVAGWFTEAGLIDVLIDQQMHDAGNQIHEGRAIDGVRSWDIRFSTKPTAQPPRPATGIYRSGRR